jgi:hypothetical protein
MRTSTSLLLLILACVGCHPADATVNVVVGQPGSYGGPTPCESAGCDGTYKFCWTGDYSGNSLTACTNSGAGTVNGERTGGAIESGTTGNEFRMDSHDDRIAFPVSSSDLIDNDVGTIWMSVWIDYTTAPASNCYTGESFRAYDSGGGSKNNKIAMYISTGKQAVGAYQGEGGTTQTAGSGSGITLGDAVWARFHYGWDEDNDKHKAGLDGSWGTENAETLDQWNCEPDDFTIGEYAAGGTMTDPVYIDNVYVTAGYADEDPYDP